MSEQMLPAGSIVHSRMSDGDRHDVQIDSSAATTTYHLESPARRIAYTVTRAGDVLTVKGIFGGAPISKTIPIDHRPWYQGIERSLHDFVVTGESRPLVFWIVQPWEANAYLLQARAEGQERITVNDRQMTALRVRVSPVGFLRFFWSSLYWFRPSDGRFLRYEAVRGFPGTPKTVVEFIGDG